MDATRSDPCSRAKCRVLDLTLRAWVSGLHLSPAEEAERTALVLLLAPQTTLGGAQALADANRLHELHGRASAPGAPPLSEAQAEELVEVLARLARYEASKEGVARGRLFALTLKEYSPEGLTAEERAEYRELDSRWPPLPPDPSDPLAEQFRVIEEVWARLERGDALEVDGAAAGALHRHDGTPATMRPSRL